MLGNNLRFLRKQKRLTQQQVAASLGLQRVTYTQYELNKREPDNETLQRLADFFKVTTDHLLKGEDHDPIRPELAAGPAAGLQKKIAGRLPHLSEKNLKLIKQMIDALPDEK